MKAVLWIAFSVILIVGPPLLGGLGVPIGGLAQWLSAFVGLMVLVAGTAVVTVTRLYVRTKANEGFVRTGQGGAKVILDGGSLVIPVVHEIVRVPLETMRLDVDRTGGDALITQDKLRADLKAEFYIRVQPNQEDVLNAARSLGEKTFDLRSIEELVKDKLVSTLRAVAATKSLDELNAKREEFAAMVKEGVEADLRHNGLTLETVTVSSLDQTDPSLLNPNNVFDAQGLRRIAEITQAALIERNEIERDAERAKAQKDVQTKKEVLELEREQAEFEAGQKSSIAQAQARKASEAKQAQIEQEQLVAQREVDKRRAIEQSQLEAQQKLIVSRRQQEVADVQRQQAVETAERDKMSGIAEAEVRRAEVETRRFEAEAQRERALQEVKTVEVTAAAEREGEQKLIAAKKAAEQDRYRKQVDADVIAYALQREAEGKKAAAEAEYAAKVRQAEADATSATKRAEGETALRMVPVNVSRSQVDVEAAKVGVERQRVEVEAQSLQNREKYSGAALEFELGKLRIEAGRETQVAIAKALGEFMSKASFNMFGDPESAQRMLKSYFRGMGLGQSIDGFMAGTSLQSKGLLDKVGGQVADLIRHATEPAAAAPQAEAVPGPVLPADGAAGGKEAPVA
jgi:flotillin